MNVKSLILLLVCFATSLTAAPTESPSTFDLNRFTFSRPKSWEWEEIKTPKDPTVVLRYVDKKSRETARTVMIHYPAFAGLGKKEAALKRWQAAFLTGELASKQQAIGNSLVTFAEVTGTHKGEKVGGTDGPLPDWALLGVIISDDCGNIVMKMTGPRVVVQKCKAEFHKMIEQGVKKHSRSADVRKD